MTHAQAIREARRWIKRALPLLGLAHWTITALDERPENEDALASIAPLDTRHTAVIRLADAYLDLDAEERRLTMTHELVHCHMAQVDAVFGDVQRYVTDTSWGHLERNFCRQRELLVDDLAVLLAPHLPPLRD